MSLHEYENMCFHCAVSLHILTFYSQWHRIIENTQDLEKGGSRKEEKYLPQLQPEWNFDVLGKKELHMMLNGI